MHDVGGVSDIGCNDVHSLEVENGDIIAALHLVEIDMQEQCCEYVKALAKVPMDNTSTG